MSRLDKLQAAVASLSPEELAQFGKWLDGQRKKPARHVANETGESKPRKRGGLAAQALAGWKAGKGKLT